MKTPKKVLTKLAMMKPKGRKSKSKSKASQSQSVKSSGKHSGKGPKRSTNPTPSLFDSHDEEEEEQGAEVTKTEGKEETEPGSGAADGLPQQPPALTPKETFNEYLVTSGIKYAVVRAIVALYEDDEKPDDPLSWILHFIGLGIPTAKDFQAFQDEATVYRRKIQKLQHENRELSRKLEVHTARQETEADKELRKMVEELTERGVFAPLVLTSTVPEDNPVPLRPLPLEPLQLQMQLQMPTTLPAIHICQPFI